MSSVVVRKKMAPKVAILGDMTLLEGTVTGGVDFESSYAQAIFSATVCFLLFIYQLVTTTSSAPCPPAYHHVHHDDNGLYF